jgi:hypothetical protein
MSDGQRRTDSQRIADLENQVQALAEALFRVAWSRVLPPGGNTAREGQEFGSLVARLEVQQVLTDAGFPMPEI